MGPLIQFLEVRHSHDISGMVNNLKSDLRLKGVFISFWHLYTSTITVANAMISTHKLAINIEIKNDRQCTCNLLELEHAFKDAADLAWIL